MTWELAQLNVLKAKYDNDDPRFAGFVDHLDRINTLGDQSPGAVWRYGDEPGAAVDTHALADTRILLNLTVWKDVESLWNYAYKSEHVEFLQRRTEWFEVEVEATAVMWWVPEGDRPTPQGAIERLEHLRTHGSSPYAFSFRDAHEPPRN